MKIRIKDCQRKITINKKKIDLQAQQVLKIKGIKAGELSILFVGSKRICTLNRDFRKIDRPTDVLAFSMCEGKDAGLHPEILGDIVICPQIAKRYAKIYKTTIEYEICLYLVHGILHLLGYNDASLKTRSAMEREEARILKRIVRK